MKESNNLIINVKGKEYTMTKAHYIKADFRPIHGKKPGWVKATLYLNTATGIIKIVDEIAQKEWKRILGLGIFRFVPDKTNNAHARWIKRYYLKD
jgi:hypothetical protein